jgi:inosine/xanthosine triphosphatase
MVKIAIGTVSSYKVNAVKKALYELDFEFEAISVNAASEISEQPLNAGETKEGSINRAKNALNQSETADLGIGVEFGYEPIDDRFHMICWASIVTKEGKILSEHSSSLQLPKQLQEVLLKNEDVSDNLDTLIETLEDIERNRLFIQYLKKRKFIYECVGAVAIRYLLDKEAY